MSLVRDYLDGMDRVMREEGMLEQTPAHDCFYCADTVEHGVEWAGRGAHIYLHHWCFFRLFTRLARDAHELETLNLHHRPLSTPDRTSLNIRVEALRSFELIERWTSDPRVRAEAGRMHRLMTGRGE